MPTAPSHEETALKAALRGQFDVQRVIGRGGMGIVLAARDLRLDRGVALKMLPLHVAGDAAVRARFLREARTAAGLTHPNIVPIHHADEVDGLVYFAMGLVEGPSLAQALSRNGPFDPERALAILIDVTTALGYAHQRGVIHRDVKAENILLDDRHGGRAMVTDFGIARVAEATPATATGTVLGSVHYMSPEQVAGDTVDGRSDLYAVGVLGYLMVSGRFPFDHDTSTAVLLAHVTRSAPPLRDVAPAAPDAYVAIVTRLLAKDPQQRFQGADDLLRALRAAQEAIASAPPLDATISSADAQAVWQRAADLERGLDTPLSVTPRAPVGVRTEGFSVQQVRAAGREAGLKTEAMDRALVELQMAAGAHAAVALSVPPLTQHVNRWAGVPMRLDSEIALPGELSVGQLQYVAAEMHRSSAAFGSVSVLKNTVTWVSRETDALSGCQERKHFIVASRDGRTVVTAHDNFTESVVGVLVGVTLGAGGGIGGAAVGQLTAAMGGRPLAGAAAALAIIGAAYGVARLIVARVVRYRKSRLETRLHEIAAIVRQTIANP